MTAQSEVQTEETKFARQMLPGTFPAPPRRPPPRGRPFRMTCASRPGPGRLGADRRALPTHPFPISRPRWWGAGLLTLPLAPHVAEAAGLDPGPEMLAEAGKSARTAGITNVTWVQGNSADLPGDVGRFLLVTMGRSFHWIDREQVHGPRCHRRSRRRCSTRQRQLSGAPELPMAASCRGHPASLSATGLGATDSAARSHELAGRPPAARADTRTFSLPARRSTSLRIRASLGRRAGHRLPLLDLATASPPAGRPAPGVRTRNHRHTAYVPS